MRTAGSITQQAVYLHAAAMFHIADFGFGLAVTQAGGSHAFLNGFTPSDFLQQVEQHQITHCVLVPSMIGALLQQPGLDDRRLASVQSISYGAAPISLPILRQVIARWPWIALTQFYGLTESTGAVVTLSARRHLEAQQRPELLDFAGAAMPGHELRVVDVATRQVLPHGVPGEIEVRGEGVMLGYWRDTAGTAASISADGWLRTGDVGMASAEGLVKVQDRLKDMIISGGENIYSVEVESVLLACPGVLGCAVIGLPDAAWGERVHAVVVLAQVPDEPEEFSRQLTAFCRARLASFKAPRTYTLRTEALPLSGVGKVQKRVLVAQAMAQPG